MNDEFWKRRGFRVGGVDWSGWWDCMGGMERNFV